MNRKEITALQRLARRLERLAAECLDCRAEMLEFELDYAKLPIDPANFPSELDAMVAEIKEKIERQDVVEQLDDLPF